MRKVRFGITYGLSVLLAVFIAGCGQETVNVPSVVSTIPANGATNVAINSPISANFSMAMSVYNHRLLIHGDRFWWGRGRIRKL